MSAVCKTCRQRFQPEPEGAIVCSADCAMTYAVSTGGKARKRAAVKAKSLECKADAVKRLSMKSRADWLKEAKTAVQAARRLEELAKGSGCMSCGRTRAQVEAGPWRPGGYWDGGHFLSKGSRPELALEPLNIWLQCKPCNAGSGKYARKGATVNASFEANLIEQKGLAFVEWLKGPHDLNHYTVDELKFIKTMHTAKANSIKKEHA